MLLVRSIWLDMKDILRSARQIINAELAPLNLSGAEGDVLFLLLTGSNNLQQEKLAAQLDVDKAAVSRVVNSLESKGYVSRLRQDTDKRAYSITLTDHSVAVGPDIKRIYDQLYQRVRSGIPDDEILQIESLLSRVADNLQSMEDGKCSLSS